MEIERLDEADAVAVDREQADDQGVAPPETRDQQAYRAEYRATVEAAYTWDAAALELRQAWEAHETKWPSPEDADRDGDRSLNPEANAEVERGCGQIREIAENVITPAMRAIESEDPDRHLIGLEHCLKGTDASRKRWRTAVRYKRPCPREALETLKDAIRFTLCYSEERIPAGVIEDLNGSCRGFQPCRSTKNSWAGGAVQGQSTADGETLRQACFSRYSFTPEPALKPSS